MHGYLRIKSGIYRDYYYHRAVVEELIFNNVIPPMYVVRRLIKQWRAKQLVVHHAAGKCCLCPQGYVIMSPALNTTPVSRGEKGRWASRRKG